MNHSSMLTRRRKKQKTQKQLARVAKQDKKLKKQTAGAGAQQPAK